MNIDLLVIGISLFASVMFVIVATASLLFLLPALIIDTIRR